MVVSTGLEPVTFPMSRERATNYAKRPQTGDESIYFSETLQKLFVCAMRFSKKRKHVFQLLSNNFASLRGPGGIHFLSKITIIKNV